ncbi:MAG: hypothetical protein JSV56_04935 [Methanomassiliicoccales archaeon]|nr:MAG: hypothetical protein JSV56_04935 [Methanomassiliicoccales archaeon]
MKEKVLITWSGGKDSALALFELQKTGKYEIAALLATITEDYDRISMHGVKRILVAEQSKSLDLALDEVCIFKNASNE